MTPFTSNTSSDDRLLADTRESQIAAYLDGWKRHIEQVGTPQEIYRRPATAFVADFVGRINAVKAVEIGDGFAAARLRGEENADRMRPGEDGPEFLSNHAGGIAGGISTGQPIVVRMALKPTSSILIPRDTIDSAGQPSEVITKGRHDPCVGIRATPIAEAMLALVVMEHALQHRAQCADVEHDVAPIPAAKP